MQLLLSIPVAVVIAVVMSGCATTGNQQAEEALPSSAVTSLGDIAARQRADGSYTDAQATLERALRVEPRNPQLWYQLAQVQMDLGAYKQAENMALRAIRYTSDNQNLRSRLWRLIADARHAAGDDEGAGDALNRAANN